MPEEVYRVTNKEQLVLDAMQIAGEALEAIPPNQHGKFTQRLAGLLATYWPTSQEADLLRAIAQEAERCGA